MLQPNLYQHFPHVKFFLIGTKKYLTFEEK